MGYLKTFYSTKKTFIVLRRCPLGERGHHSLSFFNRSTSGLVHFVLLSTQFSVFVRDHVGRKVVVEERLWNGDSPLSIEVGRVSFSGLLLIGILPMLKVACLPSHPLEKLVTRKKRRGSEARQCKTRVCTGRGYLEVIIWTRLLFRYLIWPEWEEIKQGGVDVSSQFLLVWVGPTRRGWFRTLGSEETNLLNNENMLWFLHVIRGRHTEKKKEEKELGVGAYITGCLLTKPCWQAPPVRLLFLTWLIIIKTTHYQNERRSIIYPRR